MCVLPYNCRYRGDVTPTQPAVLTQTSVEAELGGLGRPDLGRVEVVDRTGSTSTDLLERVRAAPRAWPDRSVLVADHQDAGRGRAGRTWTAPAGTALTFSVLLRPAVGLDSFGWVPLIAGLAVVQAVADVGVRAGLKWPNDVVVAGGQDALPGWGGHRKLAGLLGDLEVTPDGPAVVVGIGVNVSQQREDLPVESATSLALATDGEPVGRARLLGMVLARLLDLDDRWRAAGGDARSAGLAERCASVCVTLGRPVRVELPGQRAIQGVASGLGADGSLEVTLPGGAVRAVLAGDVHHLREVT